MKLTAVFTLLAALALPAAALAHSATPPEPCGIALEGCSCRYPAHLLPIAREGRSLQMAYMDVASPTPNGRADIFERNGLLHMEAPERFNSTLTGFLNQP